MRAGNQYFGQNRNDRTLQAFSDRFLGNSVIQIKKIAQKNSGFLADSQASAGPVVMIKTKRCASTGGRV
jgi:hypothetical protein